jgi:sugar/nucleoside kinase (ribokinase family)
MELAKFDAVFVGLTILDIAGRPVSAIPEGDGVAFIEEIRMNPAGTAAGAVMNAAKLGCATAAVACVGADEKGDFILGVYQRLGIDCSLVQRTDKAMTSATILTIRLASGERALSSIATRRAPARRSGAPPPPARRRLHECRRARTTV